MKEATARSVEKGFRDDHSSTLHRWFRCWMVYIAVGSFDTPKEIMSKNSIFTIHPYKKLGIWMFDDPSVDLKEEAFVSGADDLIEVLVSTVGIKHPHRGFTLHFSANPFPGHQLVLERREASTGGTWYYSPTMQMEGWLCGALFLYFKRAPERLYIQAKAQR